MLAKFGCSWQRHAPEVIVSNDNMKTFFVYILSSNTGTLYIGVTNDLQRRLNEHKQRDGFTKKYEVFRLVYFETFHHANDAIAREKQLKRWRRSKKKALIETINPKWQDLSEGWE